MSIGLSRRDFVRFATISVAGLLAPGAATLRHASAADAADKPLYAFPFLGDIHYDKWAHHDLDWVKKEKPGDVKQMEGYVATTEKYTPKLLAEVAAAVKGLQAQNIAVPFV